MISKVIMTRLAQNQLLNISVISSESSKTHRQPRLSPRMHAKPRHYF